MMKLILSLYFTLSSTVLLGQKIIDFDYSSCINKTDVCTDCVMESRSNDYYQIRFKAFQNCIGNFDSKVNWMNDSTLNFDIHVKGTLENKEVEVALCDCIFEFKYKLTSVEGKDIQIRINGLSVKEYNNSFLQADMSIDSLIFENDDPFGWETDSISNQDNRIKP